LSKSLTKNIHIVTFPHKVALSILRVKILLKNREFTVEISF